MRYFAALSVVMMYALLCLICWIKYRQRHVLAETQNPDSSILISYASQTGTAEQIATQSLQQLQTANTAAMLLPLNKVDSVVLANTRIALFIVSTYGEGEPPDNAATFLRRFANFEKELDFSQMQYAVLALGDSSYQHFCGFGRALEHALHHSGAKPLFDLIEVDKDDAAALRHWQYYLGQVSGQSDFADWAKPTYEQWRLHARACLNHGSPGNPVYHLQLKPIAANIESTCWQAGDIAEIGPCNSPVQVQTFIEKYLTQVNALNAEQQKQLRTRRLPESIVALPDDIDEWLQQLPELPHREYSIASITADGTLDLVVRQMRDAAGHLGLGSGWLTEYAQQSDDINLRIRTNKHFHSPDHWRPLILIGNGTGLAGLRAHLRARPAGTRNWLLFGERTLENDFFFSNEILAWKESGHLTALDLTFSRDQNDVRYVQHALLKKPDEIKSWVESGAAIYVCGSLHGMAQGVDDALTQILGAEQLEQLAEENRYCRDVY